MASDKIYGAPCSVLHATAADTRAPAQTYPGKSPYSMRPVEECVAEVALHAGAPLEAIRSPLHAALGRVLACDVVAHKPIPSFPASIMDGFAIRAADKPGCYPVDVVAGGTAGGPLFGPVPEGHVRYITTGARVPEGADAVVKVEDTKEVWEDGRLMISVSVSSKSGDNIRQIGSDTRHGEVVLRAGTRVSSGEIGNIAALGVADVLVHPRPRIAVISTGDELVDVGEAGSCDESRGQVVDCNRPMLNALVTEAGAEALDFGIVKDEPIELRERFVAALKAADIIVTSGGVSRGSKDHMKALLEELGQIHFGEMCMKPGKPTTFATVPAPEEFLASGGNPRVRLAFALPGNPVSCFVTFKLLVVPAIEQLSGRPVGAPVYPRVDAELVQPIEMDPMRPEYHRAVARWEAGRIVAESTGFQRSSRIASVAAANCLLEIPRHTGVLPRGTLVKGLLLPSNGCLSPEPAGYPWPIRGRMVDSAPPLAGPATPVVRRIQVARDGGVEAKRRWRIGLLTLGTESGASRDEALDCLRGLGVEDSDLLQATLAVDAKAVLETIQAWSSGGGVADGQMRDVILVLGSLGISENDSVIVNAIKRSLEREAPGVADAVLRAGLPRSPLVMLTQLVAGIRNLSFVVTVPHAAPVECLQVIWQLLAYAVPLADLKQVSGSSTSGAGSTEERTVYTP